MALHGNGGVVAQDIQFAEMADYGIDQGLQAHLAKNSIRQLCCRMGSGKALFHDLIQRFLRLLRQCKSGRRKVLVKMRD